MADSASAIGQYEKTTLKSGLRVVTEKMTSVRSLTLGVWIDVGSRHEQRDENGVSHLIEHMLFKGTRNRSAEEIASALESIGGSINAFTTKEQTCYHARILDEHLEIAVDVLADLVCNSTLTTANLRREKLVIAEEIRESEETPSDYIHDLFAQAYWGNHPLGRPIVGDIPTVTGLPRARIMRFIKNNYRPGSIIVSAAGSLSHKKLVKLVQEKFSFEPGTAETAEGAARNGFAPTLARQNDNNQIHICLGYPGVPYTSRDRIVALVLNAHLGGGMSSVLFQKIREEKGLAYTVYTFHDFFRDAGVFGAYLATDRQNLVQAVRITRKHIQQMRRRKITEERLAQLKAQIKGHITLGMESTYSRMSRLGRTELLLSRYVPLRTTLREIDKVTTDDMRRVANELFHESQMSLAVLGPVDATAVEDVARS